MKRTTTTKGDSMSNAKKKTEKVIVSKAQLEKRVGQIAKVLRLALDQEDKGIGFALMLFDYGDKGSFAYAADAERPSVVALLREAIEKIEGAK